MVKYGQTTWKQLQDEGKSLPTNSGRPRLFGNPIHKIRQQIERVPVMKCILDTCECLAESRGLCHAHYQTAFRWVRNRQGTWEQLERDGFARPKSRFNDHSFQATLKNRYAPTAIEIATQQATALPGLPTSNECRQITPLPEIKPEAPGGALPWKDYGDFDDDDCSPKSFVDGGEGS